MQQELTAATEPEQTIRLPTDESTAKPVELTENAIGSKAATGRGQ